MIRLLPIDLINTRDGWSVVCIETKVFKPTKPFFVDDLYERFPEIFSSKIESSDTAFVKKMSYSQDSKIKRIPKEEFVQRFSKRSETQKIGLIFHVSRCGSTLFANLLKCSSQTIVFSEPTIINAILDPKNGILDDTKVQLIEACLNCFSHFSNTDYSHLIIKFRSWNLLYLELIFAIRPLTPSLFIHRDGLEVMSSNITKPSGWLRAKDNYSDIFSHVLNKSQEEIKKMSQEEYVLNILGAFVRKILDFKTYNITSLNYIDLKENFLKVCRDVFSLEFNQIELEDMNTAMDLYSKDRNIKFSLKLKIEKNYEQNLINLNEKLVERFRVQLNKK